MPIDISQNIDRFEVEDTRQFTFTASVSRPSTVAFIVYNTNGNSLALEGVQSGATVQESGTNTGLFYMIRVLPTSVGLYFYEWRAWDSVSRTYITRGEFEMMRTEPVSFATYADVTDVIRSARQIFGRGDITIRDLRPYVEAGDQWIDSWLGRITATPLGSASPIVRDMSKVYALYGYYADRYSVERQDAPPAIVARKDRYDDLLQAVMAGSAQIAGINVSITDDVSVLTGAIEGGVPVFGMRDWESQVVDVDITQAENDRDG